MRPLLRTALLRATFPLVELPAYLGYLAGACAGRLDDAAGLHGRVCHRLTGVRPGRARAGRLLATAVVALPLNLGLFGFALYLWSIPPVNLAYPLRPDTTPESVQRSWGGPTLAGAWAVHAVGATAFFVVVGLPLLCGLAWLQVRLLRLLMGVQPPLGDPAPPAPSR